MASGFERGSICFEPSGGRLGATDWVIGLAIRLSSGDFWTTRSIFTGNDVPQTRATDSEGRDRADASLVTQANDRAEDPFLSALPYLPLDIPSVSEEAAAPGRVPWVVNVTDRRV